jgi:hypothetical protein
MQLKDKIKVHKEQIMSLVSYLKKKLKTHKQHQRWVLTLNSHGTAEIKLESLLSEVGLFSFYPTNSGKLLNVSQVVYYLEHGWKALEQGYTAGKHSEVEIHHFNGDVTDDGPRNLVALSSGDHYYVSACQNGTFNLQDFFWQNYKASDNPTPFNNQGRAIKNHAKFLARIISSTIFNTQRWLEKVAMRTSYKVKQIVSWVLKKLGNAVYKGVQSIKEIAVNPQEVEVGQPLLNPPKTTWWELKRAILKPVIV